MTRAALAVALLCLAGPATAAAPATLSAVKTEWQNLYGAIVYTATAQVTNTGSAPLPFVKVRLQLLDKNGTVVAERIGYNLAAEALDRDPMAAVKPIPPGASDPVRLSLDKSEIGKPFRSATLTIVP